MVKNVSVIDESGRLIGTTYPKRAKGLVKSGRARYVSCESEDTICLTCPPDMKEDNTMTDKSLDVAFTETINETLSLAEEALKDVIYPNKNKEITPSLILNVVAEHFGVKIENIVSKNRTAEVAMARQVVMYLCREMTDSSLQEIGKILGGRDHTIIMHGVDKISDEINKNEDLKNKIDIIKKKINPF